VHHVAFRAPDEEALHAWTERLRGFRLPSSGEVERFYFRSLYFREPNGILFEIATDGPGFTVDEPLAKRSARACRCRPSSNRAARRSRPG
jgi:glyoxalase family protein